MEAKF